MTRDDSRPVDDPSTDISNRVVRAVASALDVDPLDLDPLYETVDPDALNELFQTSTPRHTDGCIEFTTEECMVAVYGTGRIEVVPPDETLDTTESSMPAGNSRQRTDGS